MEITRQTRRQIMVGNVPVGGGAPISVQSMTDTDTRDIKATAEQIRRLEAAGCEIIRVGVPDEKAARAICEIKKEISIPLVADIHFDHQLALISIEMGADAIRINPGTIGSKEKVRKIINRAKESGISIRIGVNSGSVEKDMEKRYPGDLPRAMTESLLRWLDLFDKEQFYDLKIALKSSSVTETISAYRLVSRLVDFPLHIGVTEAGGGITGTVRSAVGLGILLAEGIGDTLRVSLTADPAEEVKAGWEILKALNLRQRGLRIISCPTCARKEFDVVSMVREVETELGHIKSPVTISILGCVVNGVGEGKHADIGIAGSRDNAILFKKGKILRKISKSDIMCSLIKEVETIL